MPDHASGASNICGDLATMHAPGYGTTGMFRTCYIDDLVVVADDTVLELVLACGGAISAEHGLGTAKARWLTAARGADEVAAMRRVKAALDEAGVLNPGVILE